MGRTSWACWMTADISGESSSLSGSWKVCSSRIIVIKSMQMDTWFVQFMLRKTESHTHSIISIIVVVVSVDLDRHSLMFCRALVSNSKLIRRFDYTDPSDLCPTFETQLDRLLRRFRQIRESLESLHHRSDACICSVHLLCILCQVFESAHLFSVFF